MGEPILIVIYSIYTMGNAPIRLWIGSNRIISLHTMRGQASTATTYIGKSKPPAPPAPPAPAPPAILRLFVRDATDAA